MAPSAEPRRNAAGGPEFGHAGAPTRSDILSAWSIRAAAFIGVGLVAGLLFDQGRAHADTWREAAITVAVREREGMVALARGQGQ